MEVVHGPVLSRALEAGLLEQLGAVEHVAGVKIDRQLEKMPVIHQPFDEDGVDVGEHLLELGHVALDVVVHRDRQILGRHELHALGGDTHDVGWRAGGDLSQDFGEEIIPVGAVVAHDLEVGVCIDFLDERQQARPHRRRLRGVTEIGKGNGSRV